jgi:DNA repair exonuclease SbcCD ATPase subunit
MAGEFQTQECIECGVRFGVTPYFDERRRADKRSFWCPNGHTQAYVESEADRLRGELDKTRRERDQLKQNEAWWSQRLDLAREEQKALKAQVKKITVRVGQGVCPCCNRQFVQLKRHMAVKHPTYKEAAA